MTLVFLACVITGLALAMPIIRAGRNAGIL